MDERDRLLFQDIVEHAEEARRYMAGVSPAKFRADRRLRLTIERLLEIVGEAAGGLSDAARAEVEYDWRAVRGLRNVLTHQYGAVDPDLVHRVVTARLPALIAAIRRSLK